MMLLRTDKMLPAKEGGGEKKEREREETHTHTERENAWEGSCATSAAGMSAYILVFLEILAHAH